VHSQNFTWPDLKGSRAGGRIGATAVTFTLSFCRFILLLYLAALSCRAILPLYIPQDHFQFVQQSLLVRSPV
jgi:hypothetical protein|tara:strand:- start:762 stop:977 length:216 start_codon:yes stop_codon:yes gene_type:complete